jgi:hypothetical protein
MSEEFVTDALQALKRADAGLGAGPQAEIRALLAFRRQQRRRKFRKTAVWAAIAAAMVLGVVRWPAREPAPTPALAVTPVEQPRQTVAAAVEPPQAPAPRPIAASKKAAREIATGFYPLVESAPPLERGLIVRVTVPASTMRSFGLPVGDEYLSDPVMADVLVGQDDLARAIRFVSYQKN